LTFVIVANLIGLLMLYGQILALVNSWITILGVLSTAFAGVIVADYFITRPLLNGRGIALLDEAEPVNWAGVVSSVGAVLMAHLLLNHWVPMEFFSTLLICLVLYPALRLTVFRPSVNAPGSFTRI
jgi:cytosine permease